MKNLVVRTISFCTFIGIILLSHSCERFENFLDKPPGVDVNEDTIFSNQTQIETFIATLYREGLHSTMAINDGNSPNPTAASLANGFFGHSGSANISSVGFSDEGQGVADWGDNRNFNKGLVNVTNIHWSDMRHIVRWYAIRRANVLLERIEDAPVPQNYKDQVKGEAYAIRAMNYFEMFKRYGGVPIIDKRLGTTDILDYPLGRRSIEDVVNFIVTDCDQAAALLPNSYPSNMRGRVTRGVALLIKAKTLLTAASPLFNTATPYLDLGEHNNLICYGNYEVSRWQKAADAAKAVLDWAAQGHASLITDKGADKNYKYVWETHDNPEILLANKFLTAGRARNAHPFTHILFPGGSAFPGTYGTTILFNFVRRYEKRDGTPQTWDMDGGNDLQQKYEELDYRFKQTVGYNQCYWNATLPVVNLYEGHGHYNNCWGGHWQRKFVPDAINNSSGNAIPHNYLYRLADAYLIYAEALNEAQGPIQAAQDAVNAIRNRSGQPNLPSNLTKEQFRERVRNERTIELAFENNRLWDATRWMTAESEIGGDMYGLRIKRVTTPSVHFTYEPYVPTQVGTRVFRRGMYLHCFLQAEVDKGYLVQNPGW